MDLSDCVSLRSLDGCISPPKRERKREGRRGVQLNYHLPLLDARVFVYCFFFFLTFLCPYTAVIQIIWHVNFEGMAFASSGFRVYVYRRVCALHPTGTLWSAQGFLMMVRPLCEASAADLYASWSEKNLQIFFFFSFRTSHMMPNCTCEKKMARREKNPSRKQTCKLKSARKRRRPQRLFIMISKCFVCRRLW